MDYCNMLILSVVVLGVSAWSVPFYPMRGPPRLHRFVRHLSPHPPPYQLQHHRIPVHESDEAQWQRPKRDHDFDHDHDHDHDRHEGHGRGNGGVTGPVHTFVKTDKNANYKWGVRHHVGNKYAP